MFHYYFQNLNDLKCIKLDIIMNNNYPHIFINVTTLVLGLQSRLRHGYGSKLEHCLEIQTHIHRKGR